MKIFENSLNQNGVSIIDEKFSSLIGNPIGTCSFQNSIYGRQQLELNCDVETIAEVYKVWGATSTVIEPCPVVTLQPTFQQVFNASVMVQLAKLKAGVK